MKSSSENPLPTPPGLALDGFSYRGGQLYVDDLPMASIAEVVDTPTYIYSATAIRNAYERTRRAFAPLGAHPHYALKASANLHICRLLRGLGAGMDVVSGGEMERAWLAGTPMAEIVFAGVAKTESEIRSALDGRFSPLVGHAERFGQQDLETRGPVGLFNVESASELVRTAEIAAELGQRARVSIRVNPNVDARTHEYTTTGKKENKFGISYQEVCQLFNDWAGHPAVELKGLHVHIGSPVREVEPFVAATQVLLALLDDLEAAGHHPESLDLGGGWAVDYHHGEAPTAAEYAAALEPLLRQRVKGGLRILLEPGRSILANAGVLVTRVQYLKEGREKRFVLCDAGMHTLIRPALYQAFHFMWPVEPRNGLLPPVRREKLDLPNLHRSDVVGPICESGDFLARDRELPDLQQGDLLAIFSAGAYGMSMSSNYNDHGRPMEVLVDGATATVIHQRQSLVGLLENERVQRKLEI
jgi:diaminopimelate decarboxylase